MASSSRSPKCIQRCAFDEAVLLPNAHNDHFFYNVIITPKLNSKAMMEKQWSSAFVEIVVDHAAGDRLL